MTSLVMGNTLSEVSNRKAVRIPKRTGRWSHKLRKDVISGLSRVFGAVAGDQELGRVRAIGAYQSTVGRFEKRKSKIDLCFPIPEKSCGWILEAVCHEITANSRVNAVLATDLSYLPRASAYFFPHYHFYLTALKHNPRLWSAKSAVWYTHPKSDDTKTQAVQMALSRTNIISMCSLWKNKLVSDGLKEETITTLVGGADPHLFQAHTRGSKKIGFCTAYYERKSPERIFNLVRARPQNQFILMGKGWKDSPYRQEIQSLTNLEYREGNYSLYPSFYHELDVFVSLSELEGGPIPLLESMMSNVVPVATKTGFAPDVIRHGSNGYLCETDASTDEVSKLVDLALQNTSNVRDSAVQYSWQNYTNTLLAKLGLSHLAKT